MIWMDVDTALAEVPVNICALIDDTDFKTREESVTYDQAGIDLVWNFVTTAGAMAQTAVTPTTAGLHDWASQGNGMYSIEIPASTGTINNDTEGFGWFTGFATGVLPWCGPVIGFRAAALNNALVDGVVLTSDLVAIEAALAAGGNVEDLVSDTYSRLLLVEASIDSDQLIVDAKTSDTHSRLVVMEAAIDSDQLIVDAKTSDTHSRLVVVEAAIDSDTASAATIVASMSSSVEAIEAGGGSLTAAQDSKLTRVQSDAILIYSDTTAIEAGGGALTVAQDSKLTQAHSDTAVIETKTSDTHSRLVVVEAAIDSDQLIVDAKTSDTHSRLVVVEAAIDSDQTSRATAISDVKSELVIVSGAVATLDAAVDSDQTSRTSAISDVKSELVVISGAVATVDSAIDSDQTSRTAAISDVKSALTVAASDVVLVEAVTTAIGATAAANLALAVGASGIVTGAAEAGTLSTTVMTTDLTQATDDHYIGRVIVWTSGALAGQATDITDYAGVGGTLTYTAVTDTPIAGDTFFIA